MTLVSLISREDASDNDIHGKLLQAREDVMPEGRKDGSEGEEAANVCNEEEGVGEGSLE